MKLNKKNTAVILIAVFFILLMSFIFLQKRKENSLHSHRVDNLNQLKEYVLEFKDKYNRYPPQLIKTSSEITVPFVDTLILTSSDNSDIYKYYYYQGGFALCLDVKNTYDIGEFTCAEIENTFI